MRFGVVLPSYGAHASRSAIREVAAAAENLGFDSVWVADHTIVPTRYAKQYGNIFEAVVVLASVSSMTDGIKLGFSSLILPLRDPILAAKQVATLDALSNGRVMLAVGVGWMPEEAQTLRADFANRGTIVEEQIRTMRKLWSSSHPVFEGRFYNVKSSVFLPLPKQKGGPRVWIAGNSRSALERTARIGDGWHPVGVSPDELSSGVKLIRSRTKEKRLITARIYIEFANRAIRIGSNEPFRFVGPPKQFEEILVKYKEAGLEYLVCDFGDKNTSEIVSQMTKLASLVTKGGCMPHKSK
jgi:probable F420-dependent oxidoreductase